MGELDKVCMNCKHVDVPFEFAQCASCGGFVTGYRYFEPKTDVIRPGQYDALIHVFLDAVDQAATGKGRERHATNEPFQKQLICAGARLYGTGAPLFQAHKKIQEASRLSEFPPDQNGRTGPERAVHELLGAMVYAAAAVIVLREQEAVVH